MSAIKPKGESGKPTEVEERINALEASVAELKRRNSGTFNLCEQWLQARWDYLVEHVTADVRKRFEEVVVYDDPDEEESVN